MNIQKILFLSVFLMLSLVSKADGPVYREYEENGMKFVCYYFVMSGEALQGEATLIHCDNKENVIIPKNVTVNDVTCKVEYIDIDAFADCKDLKSITIHSNILSFSYFSNGIWEKRSTHWSNPFGYCSKLESINVEYGNTVFDSRNNCNAVIEKNVTVYNENMGKVNVARLRAGCKNSIIPNDVEYIGHSAFKNCTDLKSILLPKNIIAIEDSAFYGCANLEKIYCESLTCPIIENEHAFDEEEYTYSILFVHFDALSDYQSSPSWKKFKNITYFPGEAYTITYIVDGEVYKTVATKVGSTIILEPAPSKEGYTFSGWSEIPETMPAYDLTVTGTFTPNPVEEKCEAPVIDYKDGKLLVNSKTEGAECVTTITSEDVNTYNGNEIEITATYNISVYAKAEGYNDSEIVTATLCWIEAEGTPTSINNRVEANAVLIQSYNGTLTITGAIEGALIEVYNVTGHNIASVSAKNGTTTIETALNAGEIALVKIKNKTIKVVVN